MFIPVWTIIIVLLLLLIVYSHPICEAIHSFKNSMSSTNKHSSCNVMLDDDDYSGSEHLTNDPKANSVDTYQPHASDSLKALGYSGDLPWDEVIQATELDPSTFDNHDEFVKDVRRFSSGANFTSVTDDNTNLAFTNFQGLRRPQHVDIGATARQIPDVDTDVLQRSKIFRWNSTS